MPIDEKLLWDWAALWSFVTIDGYSSIEIITGDFEQHPRQPPLLCYNRKVKFKYLSMISLAAPIPLIHKCYTICLLITVLFFSLDQIDTITASKAHRDVIAY